MTVGTSRLDEPTLTTAALATTFNQARPLDVLAWLRNGAVIIGELLTAVSIVFCIPLAILAIGIPIALCVRLLLWIARLL